MLKCEQLQNSLLTVASRSVATREESYFSKRKKTVAKVEKKIISFLVPLNNFTVNLMLDSRFSATKNYITIYCCLTFKY